MTTASKAAPLAIAAFVAAALTLTGCYGLDGPQRAAPEGDVTPVSKPAPAASEQASPPTSLLSSIATEATYTLDGRTYTETERVLGLCDPDRFAVDFGPAPLANGTVEYDADGRPVAYIVAEGDAPEAIQYRLCIVNMQRPDDRYIQVGERLTIDPRDATQ